MAVDAFIYSIISVGELIFKFNIHLLKVKFPFHFDSLLYFVEKK